MRSLDTRFPPSIGCPGWYYGLMKKGWTDNDYSVAWLTEVFFPLTRRGDSWRLLLVDGHGLLMTGEFQWECLGNQVMLVLLPTFMLKRRHRFQPLTHAYHSKNAARICLQQDEVAARKRAQEEEEEATTKRLRKSEE
jgi:hypothetical protein